MTESRHLDHDPREDPEIRAAREAVRLLDPELFHYPESRQLVELGLEFGREVTTAYGTPDQPRWASGAYERSAIMTYHNGGRDGHTSVGPLGAGVPRNVLRIAHTVNQAAGAEVYTPLARATAFCTAQGHDRYQLCGRSLMPEGQGEGRGDERMSAEYARDRYLAAGGSPETAQHIYDWLLVTAYNPQTRTQNVRYHPDASVIDKLGRELLGAGDWLAFNLPCGPLRAFEYVPERLCLIANGELLQQRLPLQGISLRGVVAMPDLLQTIAQDKTLLEAFITHFEGDAGFSKNAVKYSDQAIRNACGQGIDELFNYARLTHANTIQQAAKALRSGQKDLLTTWSDLRKYAGYER